MMYGGAGYQNPQNTVKSYSNFASTYNANRDPFATSSPLNRGMFFVQGQRRRMNIVAVLISLFLPWLLFCFVYGVLSFSIHYSQPNFAYALLLATFLGVVVATWYLAAKGVRQKLTEPTYQPSWYMFIAVTCLVAFVVAAGAGEWNYINHMQPYYDLQNLARYNDIDTNAFMGQQLMDAGQIDFKQGTALDLSRSMGFKNHEVYCVAPIVTKGTNLQGSVDFWAVGKNCCSGVAADFHCAGFSDPKATGVIRLMKDEDRPFYRLAVQQAEATYKMTASHPLFFEWVHSATEATDNYAHKGHMNYFLGICAYLLIQVFLTATVALAFSKLVHT